MLAGYGADISIWGRDPSRLDEIGDSCRQNGANFAVQQIDLRNIEDALSALRSADDHAPFDGAFFVAGAGDTREPGRIVESAAQVITLGMVNYVATAALAAEMGERMARRGRGRIAIVGSAAAAHPLPFAAGYASSKAGLAHFTEALRIAVAPYGVTVTLASPGFFAPTAPDAHAYARPGEISAERVAERLLTAVARGRAEVVTPWHFRALALFGAILPRALRDRLMRRLPAP
jgi:short-subunit dehydrogenase